jgi:pilus assembly protein CpaE
MQDSIIFVLLIQKDPTEAGLIREALRMNAQGGVKLQRVESLPTALARIGGGGVDVILLDLSAHDTPSADGLTTFLQLHQAAPHVPIVVLYDASGEGLALRALRAGAADYLLMESSNEETCRVIRSAVELERKHREARSTAGNASRPSGAIISFIGAKGGVGTTTIALNVSAVLAKRGKVILAEIRPSFGTLLSYFKPYGQIRDICYLLQAEGTEISRGETAASLWACKNVPGLGILFGPQSAAECPELTAEGVKKITKALAGFADYVVLDLPPSLSAANRAALEASARVVLVMERDPVCVQTAKLMARAMEAWEDTPQPIEMILVNRALLSCPMPILEIENQLGPSLGVIPPGSDICLKAQQARSPLVACQPESLVADSLVAIAAKCVSFMIPAAK